MTGPTAHRAQFALAMALAFGAAIGGAFIGRSLIARPPAIESQLHRVLHSELDLDHAQDSRIGAIEAQFAVRRQGLERELRVDNAQLASAIAAEHGYGPQVGDAVDRSHRAMGQLQKATLEHIFAMRSVLRPDQARKFDAAIIKALTVQER